MILNILIYILIFVVLLVIIFYAIHMSVLSRDAAERDLEDATKTIALCRQNRYTILGNIISQLSAPGVSSDTLKKLYELYPQANTEEREISWEKKYIPAVKNYMLKCQNGLTGIPLEQWYAINEQLEENERLLTFARQSYNKASDALDRWATKPFSYAISVGEWLQGIFRRVEKKKQEEGPTQTEPPRIDSHGIPDYTYRPEEQSLPNNDNSWQQ